MTGKAPDEGGVDTEDIGQAAAAIRRRKRVALTAAAITLVGFMAFPVITSFTTLLDGVVNGIGVGYLVGFAVMVLPVLGAVAFCLWANRVERGGGDR
ncbi:DUF485 domain-containing protein [Amycolatopsis cihanbeyliensis]|uniref:DUF485 domain-containing protein n=1 Tax=Amycolatopsis cihanbeyliensis TaxID=1128664 RepID=UPI00147751DD|nr:DUF485 domain-containing protein [Amycolatopsis cihanbeyliensis]